MRHPQRVARIVGDAGSGAHLRSLGVKAKASIMIYQLWLAMAWRLAGASAGLPQADRASAWQVGAGIPGPGAPFMR